MAIILLGSGCLILVGVGRLGKFGEGWILKRKLIKERCGDFVLDPEGQGVNFFHASLSNIFSKCHRKALLKKNN